MTGSSGVPCPICGEDLEESADGGGQGMCWANAGNLLDFKRRESGTKDGQYVEGWAVQLHRDGQPSLLKHAWVEWRDEICDDTPHHHCEPDGYFTGLSSEDPEQSAESLLKHDYAGAKQRAMEYCEQVAAARRGGKA